MKRDEVRQAFINILDSFEASSRRYLRKVETDRPAVADAQWNAIWEFRKEIMQAHDNLTMRLKQASQAKDRD